MEACSTGEEMIAACSNFILATRTHELSTDNDINSFTDTDLCILGKDQQSYRAYCSNIRKEYAVYDDDSYMAGRKKVLQHFLAMGRIFKTEYFYNRFEKQAIANLNKELEDIL